MQAKNNVLSGLVAPYNTFSNKLGNFYEVIEFGAFNSVLASNPSVIATIDHSRDSLKILGSTDAGTLKLFETPRGLEFELQLNDTTTSKDLQELVKKNELNKMSFAFVVGIDEWDFSEEIPTRTIKSFSNLSDISIVLNPAYEDTYVN